MAVYNVVDDPKLVEHAHSKGPVIEKVEDPLSKIHLMAQPSEYRNVGGGHRSRREREFKSCRGVPPETNDRQAEVIGEGEATLITAEVHDGQVKVGVLQEGPQAAVGQHCRARP